MFSDSEILSNQALSSFDQNVRALADLMSFINGRRNGLRQNGRPVVKLPMVDVNFYNEFAFDWLTKTRLESADRLFDGLLVR